MNGAFADPILYLELCDRALCRASAGRDGTNSAGQWNAAPSPAAAGAAPLMRLGFVRCKSLPRSQRALFATQPGLPTRSDTSPDLVRWQSHLAELGLTWFLFHKLNSPAPDRETMAFSMAWALAAFVALFEEYTSLDLVNAAIHGVCSAGMCSHDTPRLL